MSDITKLMCDGNEAASDIAYRLTDLAIIYPITPSSPMAENYEVSRNAIFKQIKITKEKLDEFINVEYYWSHNYQD